MRYLSEFLWTHSSDVDTLVPNNSEFLSWNSNISVLPGLNLLNFYTIVSLVGHLLRPLCRMQNKGKAKIILEFFLMLMFMITVSGLNYLYNHSESARVVRENLLTLRSRHIKKCKDSHSINNDPYKRIFWFYRQYPKTCKWGIWWKCALFNQQDQRSQKLTTREPKGKKIRGFKVKTSTQKLKSNYVSSAKQSKN